jgi:RNA polymerase sigma-70 factor (ECF subfamily)
VYASETASKNYDLFTHSEILDINDIDREILLGAIQQLVPAQRLIFNLHVIDGYSLEEAATLLESSEPTVKSNLEKARFNLQKNIKNSLISSKV